MSIDIKYLSQVYFYFDEPVPYKLSNEKYLYIKPISLKDSMILLTSLDILNIDKNSLPDPIIIQMSYLQFIYQVLLSDEQTRESTKTKLLNILILCLDLKNPMLMLDERNKCFIYDKELNIKITAKQFDDIKRIIMYQNIPNFDDEYMNPELKKSINDVNELKNRDIEIPSIERKIAIITAHCGLPKSEQLKMTYRSHELLFAEVCGEVEFTTVRPVALFSGEKNFDHWIYRKRKNKLEGYVKSIDSYTKSMGGGKVIKSTDSNVGETYLSQLNNFK